MEMLSFKMNLLLVSHCHMEHECARLTVPDESSTSTKILQIAKQKGHLGLQSLRILGNLHSDSNTQLDARILLAIIAFSSTRDLWTTPSSLRIAKQLLTSHSSIIKSSKFINEDVLQSFIRPLFSKSKPSAITSTGRQAMPTSAPPKRYNIQEQDRSSRPWKYDAVYSTTVFVWTVENASVSPPCLSFGYTSSTNNYKGRDNFSILAPLRPTHTHST